MGCEDLCEAQLPKNYLWLVENGRKMGHEDYYRDPVLHAVPAAYMERLGKVVVSLHEPQSILGYKEICMQRTCRAETL